MFETNKNLGVWCKLPLTAAEWLEYLLP